MGNGEVGNGKELTKIQIYRFVVNDTILDVSDLLDSDPRRSKVIVTLVQFDDQYKATQRVRHYVDADDFKLVCHDLLSGAFMGFEDHKGSVHDDNTEARVLSMARDAKLRQPYQIRIDNGQGEVYGNGQVKMVRATGSVTIQMPEFEARKMALIIRDYIQQWEMIHFRQRQQARTTTFTVNGDADQEGARGSMQPPAGNRLNNAAPVAEHANSSRGQGNGARTTARASR